MPQNKPRPASSSIRHTSESAPPKDAGEEPAGRSADNPAELKERLLRVLAEQQNFQRRLERERDDAVRFAATQLVKELLQTADNLSRAQQSVAPGAPDQNEPLRNLLGGVAASERALQDTFAKHGITRIQPALGEPFDPQPSPGDVRGRGQRVRAWDHRPSGSARLCLSRTATASGFRRGCQAGLPATRLRAPPPFNSELARISHTAWRYEGR